MVERFGTFAIVEKRLPLRWGTTFATLVNKWNSSTREADERRALLRPVEPCRVRVVVRQQNCRADMIEFTSELIDEFPYCRLRVRGVEIYRLRIPGF